MRFQLSDHIINHPMKFIFSVACGTMYGLIAYSRSWMHMDLHIGPFTHLNAHVNDAIQYVLSVMKAIGIGAGSWFGATAAGKLNKKYKNWKHKKHDHE